MEVFKPIKVENYQFMDSGLDQYEPLLLYIKDDVEEGKVYFVKNKFDDKLEQNLRIYGKNRVMINRGYGEVNIDVFTQDLEGSIDRLNREVQELKNQLEERKERKGRILVFIILQKEQRRLTMEDYNYLTITDAGWSSIEVDGKGLGITDLEKRIEKLEEDFRKIELKNRSKSGEIYDLMERVRQLNKTGQRYRLFLYEDSCWQEQ